MEEGARILVVDDQVENTAYMARILSNYSITVSTYPEEAVELFKENRFDIVLSDQKMPGLTGIDLIKKCNLVTNDFLGLIISAYTDSDDLVDAVNSNIIHKYILKPFTPPVLLQHVNRALETLSLRRENSRLEQRLLNQIQLLARENQELKESAKEKPEGTERLAGLSRKMAHVRSQIETYGSSENCVLITGETGTGKELTARALHEISSRKQGPLIKLNCAALPPSLIESELFGYEKNAFTGAGNSQAGFFVSAHGGTLFLDEIGDLPMEMQPKFLRVLQFGTFFPLGSRQEKKVNVRIIAASNQDLEQEVIKGRFRKDLYYRLNILKIALPALREIPLDIPVIFRHLYLNLYPERGEILLSKEAERVLMAYDFPGNVREMESIVHRLELINGRNNPIGKEQILAVIDNSLSAPSHSEQNYARNMASIEKEAIERVLNEQSGNISHTADILGFSRQGLHNKLKKYGIEREGWT